jgi:hypothetical protein
MLSLPTKLFFTSSTSINCSYEFSNEQVEVNYLTFYPPRRRNDEYTIIANVNNANSGYEDVTCVASSMSNFVCSSTYNGVYNNSSKTSYTKNLSNGGNINCQGGSSTLSCSQENVTKSSISNKKIENYLNKLNGLPNCNITVYLSSSPTQNFFIEKSIANGVECIFPNPNSSTPSCQNSDNIFTCGGGITSSNSTNCTLTGFQF